METALKENGIIFRTCAECGARINGRQDKKFCADHCRAAYNNRLNSDCTSYMRNVNNILRKNRRILATLYSSGSIKVAFSRLLECGFQFGYFTSVDHPIEGVVYHYCYEHGYRPLEKGYCQLVVRRETD